MRLPPTVRSQFQRHGRKGGRARASRLAASMRTAIARWAAVRRWIRVRFGDPSLAAAGLPGGALIDRGLGDLSAGRETVESLLVSLAAPRLRREGVPVPTCCLPDGDRRLYRLLEVGHGDLAHARYLALLRQAASFADACRAARVSRGTRAR